MADQEAEKGFTFVDRRRRGDDEAPAPEPAATRPAPPPPRPEPAVSKAGLPRADFASFCVMLYSETLVHLGQVPDPMTGQPHQDLEQAQFTIDLLAMLREKTEGNRTAEETAVLDEILANLRMAFVRGGRR
ncbi:MAG: DUF1844 domain-containing protein [Candidatus Rokuibacteriota bacterium]